jgi:hypothetical protein
MPPRILALHRTDLAAAAQLALQLQRQGQASAPPVVTVLDPVLQHHADIMGLPGVQLLRLPGTDAAVAGTARALAATRLLVQRTDAAMAALVPEAPGAAWCSHWLKALHFTVFTYRSVLPLLAQALRREGGVHLLLPKQAHRYGFHSFVPGLVLHEGLRAAGLHTTLFDNPLPAWDPLRLPDPEAATGAAPAAAARSLRSTIVCMTSRSLTWKHSGSRLASPPTSCSSAASTALVLGASSSACTARR